MTSARVVASQKSETSPGCFRKNFSTKGFKSLVCLVSKIFGKDGIVISFGNFFLFSESKLHLPPIGLSLSSKRILNFFLVIL